MHWKKYWILLLPFILTLALAIILLPERIKYLAMAVPAIFWAIYYIWVYLDNKKNKNHSEKKKSTTNDLTL